MTLREADAPDVEARGVLDVWTTPVSTLPRTTSVLPPPISKTATSVFTEVGRPPVAPRKVNRASASPVMTCRGDPEERLAPAVANSAPPVASRIALVPTTATRSGDSPRMTWANSRRQAVVRSTAAAAEATRAIDTLSQSRDCRPLGDGDQGTVRLSVGHQQEHRVGTDVDRRDPHLDPTQATPGGLLSWPARAAAHSHLNLRGP